MPAEWAKRLRDEDMRKNEKTFRSGLADSHREMTLDNQVKNLPVASGITGAFI